jgi:hypothetical protein
MNIKHLLSISVNDTDECVKVIETFNTVIDGLHDLCGGPLSANPFNVSGTVYDTLKKLGMPEGIFSDMAEQLCLYRSILIGDRLKWDKLVEPELPIQGNSA